MPALALMLYSAQYQLAMYIKPFQHLTQVKYLVCKIFGIAHISSRRLTRCLVRFTGYGQEVGRLTLKVVQ